MDLSENPFNCEISISKSSSDHPGAHREFEAHTVNLLEAVCQHHWSPNIFKGGVRKNANFEQTSLFVLDFDHGMTLAQAEDLVCDNNLACIIGLSKSHQKPKLSGRKWLAPCDRFRLILFTEKQTLKQDLVWTYAHYQKKLGADPSCKDPARFFFKCTEIYYASEHGENLDWIKKPKRALAQAKRQAVMDLRLVSNGIVPAWLQLRLKQGVPEGGRHNKCQADTRSLFELGLATTPQGAFEILKNSAYWDIDDDKEYFMRTAKRGYELTMQKLGRIEDNADARKKLITTMGAK